MVYYSANSKEKVFHLPHCTFVRSIKADNRKSFATPEDARQNHYRQCNCCSPVGQRLRKERRTVEFFCQNHGASCYFRDGTLTVTTPRSKWKIIAVGNTNKLSLYHRNTRGIEDPYTPIPKYHHQKVHKDSIVEYLDYIVEHDYFRMRHPLQPIPVKKEKPRKGTKRWRAQQKKEKKIAKKNAVKNVYALLAAI